MSKVRALATLSAALLGLVMAQALAETVYAITDPRALGSVDLVSFDSATPGTTITLFPVSGTGASTLKAIDFRPSNGLLYALGLNSTTSAQLYTINTTTGVLTAVGSSFTLAGNTSSTASIDFNPVTDQLRVVTGQASGPSQSYRVNPNTGALIAQDTGISSTFSIADVAYSNNVAGASATTLYAYDYLGDQIDTIGSVGGTPVSPNLGQTFVVGDSGLFSADEETGLDISGVTGNAYASVFDQNAGINGFYRVNLGTGAATLIGQEAFELIDFSVKTAAVVAAVPEPDSLAMLGLGLAGLIYAGRRRSIRKA